VRDNRVAERSIRVQLVMIAAALALAREVASFFEIGDDALHGPLGDPDSGCDFTQSNLRLLRDANQNVGVIAQKHPVKVGRVPTQFIYLALTPAQTSRTNYTSCGTYIISLRVRLARTSSSYHNYWAGAIQKTVICGS